MCSRRSHCGHRLPLGDASSSLSSLSWCWWWWWWNWLGSGEHTPQTHTHTPQTHTTPSLSTFHADLAAFGLRSISSHFSHCLQPWAQISRAATHWNAAEMVLHIKQCAGAANWATCSQAEWKKKGYAGIARSSPRVPEELHGHCKSNRKRGKRDWRLIINSSSSIIIILVVVWILLSPLHSPTHLSFCQLLILALISCCKWAIKYALVRLLRVSHGPAHSVQWA